MVSLFYCVKTRFFEFIVNQETIQRMNLLITSKLQNDIPVQSYTDNEFFRVGVSATMLHRH